MKARLPIFSCNLALALIANMLCVNVLYYSCKCRLFHFCPNYLLLNFGKLFSGRRIRCSAQSIDAQQNSHFQSCKNTNSESGLIIDNKRITRCAPTSPFSTISHVTVLWSIPRNHSLEHSTSKFSTIFHTKVIHHISHHRSPPHSTSPFSGAFHVKVIHHIPHHHSPPHSTSPIPTIFHVTVLWAFHVKVLHHISHHRSTPHSTSNVLRSAKI